MAPQTLLTTQKHEINQVPQQQLSVQNSIIQILLTSITITYI
jgi:hypothetical protein